MPAHWSGRLGGAEVQVRYLLRYLRDNTDHQLSVVCRHAAMTVDEGVPIHRIRTVWPLARYSYLPDYLSVQHLLHHIDPDVIYSRVGSPLVGYAARYCNRKRRALVHHIARMDDVLPRAELPPQNLLRGFERRIYEHGLQQANVVIAQATYQATLLQRHFRRDAAEVIPNFHPAPATAPVKASRPRIVLWVANVKRAKRPEAFIELARRSRTLQDTRFMMVGAMSDKTFAPHIAEAQRLGNFDYLGSASLEEVNKLMDSAHVFVNTSTLLGEGFPNTFIQAWLRGAPVLSLEVDPDSLLADGRLGLCSANSIEQMMRNLQSLLNDPGRLQQMGAIARDEAMQRFGIENLVRIRRLLEKCAACVT